MVCITDFIDGQNVSPAISAAVDAAIKDDKKLFFPPGEYHFYADGCAMRYCFFSNNDEGVKTVAILLDGIDDFTVYGEDARFIFHGRISPLCAFNCRNLSVQGISVDFEDSFVSDADLVYREDGVAWFKLPGKHAVKDGKLTFTGDFFDNLHGKLNFYPYDRSKKELISTIPVITLPNRDVLWKDGLAGVEDRFAGVNTDAFVIKHELRLCPGMVFDNCDDVQVKNVTIHHAAGMGVLIQRSCNCSVEKLSVVPSTRRTAVSDDALHITDCRGKLRIADCLLTATLDDSINVHGVFRKLKRRLPGGKMYYLEAGHFQQQGVFNIKAGDTLELLRRATGEPYARLKITGVKPCNKAFTLIDFDESELPDSFVQGDPGWILETQADLEVVNTVCRPLNGRGILASGLKNLHISGCHLHSSGGGVFISGDHGFWYESGPVENAVIENNVFDNCNYSERSATREPFAVFPELDELADGFHYHGSITVKNNLFRNSSRPLVSMMSVKNAVVKNNKFELDETYTFIHQDKTGYYFTTPDSPAAAFLHCQSVVDENNQGFRK